MPKIVKEGFGAGILATIIASLLLTLVGVFANDHVLNAEQDLKITQALDVGNENKVALKNIQEQTNQIDNKTTRIEAQLEFLILHVESSEKEK